MAASTPKKAYGAKRLKIDPAAEAAATAEHVLFAAVRDCYVAWSGVVDAAPGDGVSFAEDDALQRDGDSLLGSMVYSHTKFHERLGPPVVDAKVAG